MCACAEAAPCTLLYSTVNTAQVGGYTVLGMLEEERMVLQKEHSGMGAAESAWLRSCCQGVQYPTKYTRST